MNENVEIYNLQGQLIKVLKTRNSKLRIETTDLEKGIYLVKIGIRTQKLIIE
ncbi:MAG: T9SS type A sorting domain-containing protein [Bacteroidales bacterium]|nr:T9SS type A sorting domain-containing protein [Bacteroidales bacterium]